MEDNRHLLALNAHPRIGSQTLKKALAPFSNNVRKLWNSSEKIILQRLPEKVATLILEAREKYDPEEEEGKLSKLDMGYTTVFDKEYPPLLSEVFDSPVILYMKGEPALLKKTCLAVVGSRKFSRYGSICAYNLSKSCAKAGLVICSGLALGIDAVAHKGALDANGLTIAVLGCGLEKVYPVSNFSLSKEILSKGGLVISEFPPGTPPMKQNFPARNRIIAGLSTGTLVVEAALESGALITAYQALEYNREVFAVPGNIDSETSMGTNLLIQKGAKLVSSEADIFEELNIESKIQEEKARDLLPETEEEQAIVDFLKREEATIDEMVSELKLNVVAVNSTLSILEMKGAIENMGGARYKLKR